MSKLPFNLFKRKGRRFYYVKFKDSRGKCLSMVSTGTDKEAEALEIAFKWYREGVSSKKDKSSIGLNIKELIKNIKLEEVEYLCKILKERGLLKSYITPKSNQDTELVDYLLKFWDYDSSEYIKEKLRKEHSIHRTYVLGQRLTVEKYWKPFFKNKLLGELTKKDLDMFADNLNSIKKDIPSKGKKSIFDLSVSRKNGILRAGAIAIKWAYKKKNINYDPTEELVWFAGKGKKRNILTPELAKALFLIEWDDERSRLGNMLAMCTGLRAGEVLGLRPSDLGDECLYITNSWSSIDKLKTTKNNEPRVVELPFPMLITNLLQLTQHNPHSGQHGGFVFWAEKFAGKPMEGKLLVKGLRKALVATGMSSEESKKYDFHCWRHFYTSYMKPRLDRKLLKKQTGHLTDSMLDHYGDHLLSGERDLIRIAQKEAFGSIIPL